MAHVSFIPAGRAGNFFFTCAAAWAYARRYGLKFSVPKRTSSDFWSPIYLQHLQDPSYDEGVEQLIVTEPHFHYAPIPFDESWRNKNITLSGYYQSQLHFNEYREEMLDAFNLPWNHIPDVCSIHARFGDYLEIPGKHIIVDEPYLRAATALITEKTGITRFKVFSDDLPRFKQHLGHIYDFEYSTNTGIMEDLVEISCCHSQIGSSSTFSWWAQYLNKNPDKVIITQKLWFQDGWKENTQPVYTSDIVPENWIKL